MTTNSAQRIVVAYDGSPDASTALTWAVRTATMTGQPVAAVVATATDDLLPHRSLLRGDHLAEVRPSGEQTLGEPLLEDPAVELRAGPVVPVLLEAAADAS